MDAAHGARVAALRASLASLAEGGRVAVDEARACPRCRLRLGGKVFVVVPGGGGGAPAVLCFAGPRRGGGAAAPAEPGLGV